MVSSRVPRAHTSPGLSCLLSLFTFVITACGGRPADKLRADTATAAAEAGEPETATPSGAPPRVTLTDAAYSAAGIVVEPVVPETHGVTGGVLEAPGQVEADPSRVAFISPRAAGRLERLAASVGDQVRAGQPVAYMTSPTFLTAESDLIQAQRRLDALALTRDSAGAAALVRAARSRLRLLGADSQAITRLEAGGEPTPELAVLAPFSGSLVEVQAFPGAAVEPGTPIFRLIDLSEVIIAAEVPERNLARLRIGQQASITVAAYPGLVFGGHVKRLKTELDPTTRTVQAIVHVPNPRRILRPGMFATVRLAPGTSSYDADSAKGRSVLTIPESAVVTGGGASYAFVAVGPRTFERRLIEAVPLGAPAADTSRRVVVTQGLTPGEKVVTRGAFTLKSELAKATFAEEE